MYAHGTYIPLTNYSASQAESKERVELRSTFDRVRIERAGRARSVFRPVAHDESKSFGITVTHDLDGGAKGASPDK